VTVQPGFIVIAAVLAAGVILGHRAADRLFGTDDRAPSFDAAMIELIEVGFEDDTWTGLLYLVGVGEAQAFNPLYIGKTERRGTSHEVSRNIVNIRRNLDKFARWGYGLDYHIEDFSHAMFGFTAYRGPTREYARWAKTLFTTFDPPTLRAPVTMVLLPWHQDSRGPSGLLGSVASAEKEVIALAGALYSDRLLNVDGRLLLVPPRRVNLSPPQPVRLQESRRANGT